MLGRGLPALSILFDILNIHIGQSSWILSSLCSWVSATFEASKKENAHNKAIKSLLPDSLLKVLNIFFDLYVNFNIKIIKVLFLLSLVEHR